MTLFLGLDIGSSSIKVTLVDGDSGAAIAGAQSPARELRIDSPNAGWAEQDPDVWWEHVVLAIASVRAAHGDRFSEIEAIGVSYQMHGLVLVDGRGVPLRSAIIWCDSRAVSTGTAAAEKLGIEWCFEHLMNLPGNFTLAKLLWVAQNEPEVLERARALLLPGDYIAFKLSGVVTTTPSGLSEGTLWDVTTDTAAYGVLEKLGLPAGLIPPVVPNVGAKVEVSAAAARELGLPAGVPISYRAGDQPNNAFSLKVVHPGELATTAGTSGVIYGVAGSLGSDPNSVVNPFLHVNHTAREPRLGILLCVNGTGALYRWLRDTLGANYAEMNEIATQAAPGCTGLTVLPYGNGAERSLGNTVLGASFDGIDLNRHGKGALCRASLEGICFALLQGSSSFQNFGLSVQSIRAGEANLFSSPIFREIFVNVMNAPLTLLSTDGAQGAARGAMLGTGHTEPFRGLVERATVEPTPALISRYAELFERWSEKLSAKMVAVRQ